jgi:2'-hydroxyisoflavone reductase
LGSLASLAAVSLAGCDRQAAGTSTPDKPGGPLHILILGGTGFLGPHFVRDALARGHKVTLFNRGKTNPELFADLEQLRGDRRAGDLAALEGRRFDAVIDTSGYVPKEVTATAKLLASSGQYLFVSSVSVYRDQFKHGLRVDDPLAELPDPDTEDVPTYYGALKAACERAAEAAMPGKTTIVRPGLIVGPGDPTDRFTYWPVRIARGGEMIAPGKVDDPVQLIDARDLAAFMVDCVEQRSFKPYNAVGPAERLTVEAMLRTGIDALGSDAKLTWIPAEFLAEHEVTPWMDMPVWVPPEDKEFGGLGSVELGDAPTDGLQFRPLAETMRDTLAYWNELPEDRRAKPRAGLAAERETEVLAAFHYPREQSALSRSGASRLAAAQPRDGNLFTSRSSAP